MQLWKRLYNTVWLAFFACVLLSRWMGSIAGLPVHVLLGLAMLIMTWTNSRSLEALPVPARLKRISKVAAGFAMFQLVSGLALGAVVNFAPNLNWVGLVLRGTHVVCALAILAQSSSVATAYDMWEEKEFGETPSQQKAGIP
jgi:membrane protease YdiL (CAAX protease family)